MNLLDDTKQKELKKRIEREIDAAQSSQSALLLPGVEKLREGIYAKRPLTDNNLTNSNLKR